MDRAEVQYQRAGPPKIKAEVADQETFNWLQGICQRENRRRKYQGRETISYSIKISGSA